MNFSASSPKMVLGFIAIWVTATLACWHADAHVLGNIAVVGRTIGVNLPIPKVLGNIVGVGRTIGVNLPIPTIALNKTKTALLDELKVKKSDFPCDFAWGAGSSAPQNEGAANEGGRGPSVWDYRVKLLADKIKDSNKFSTSVFGYQRYKEDTQLLKTLGVNSYRFSISWSRILPKGTLEGGINQEGVDHYNNVINELINAGITPYVTILHFDLPQALQDKYGGYLNHAFVNDFRDYSELLFKLYGDRVKHWFTINEPSITAQYGFEFGIAPPQRCSLTQDNCVFGGATCFMPVGPCNYGGNSSTEPYIAAHHLILAHAAAAKIYREKYKAQQQGEIGIVLTISYYVPYSDSQEDRDASERLLDFFLGWYMGPLVYGEYPKSMRDSVKERLPKFTVEEKKMVNGCLDFVGINYYTSTYGKNKPPPANETMRFTFDVGAETTDTRNQTSHVGVVTGTTWAQGLGELMVYIKKKYNNPKIYITENGVRVDAADDKGQLQDTDRAAFIARHLYWLNQAIQNGVNVKGYFHWSLMDDFNWDTGFKRRSGLYFVDFARNYTRIPKLSALWYRKFLE